MNLVNLESVGKAWGTVALLQGVSLGIADGERIGVVGRNGGGKTTLVDLLTKSEPPDSGRVTHVGGLRFAVLGQHDRLDPLATVRSVVVGDRPEHDWAGDARVRDVLAGLGLANSLDRVIGPMSGGERRRVALAALLNQDLDLLVLDEPTNHLDVEGIDWLAHHLMARRGLAQLVVTHDRWFLDAVCTQVWEVTGGNVETYDGGYAAHVLAKAERARVTAVTEGRRQNLLRKELAWLRRGAPARTSKPRFRLDAASALVADEPPPRDRLALEQFATARLGKSVYDVEDVTLRLGDRELLRRQTWRLGPGDRIAVVGVNGSGKTSLLRLLAGELTPNGGEVKVGLTVRAAYLDQEVREVDLTLRVLAAVEEVAKFVDLGGGRTATAGQLLERFGFGSDRQWTRVGELSGGERRRLQILRLLMAEPNVLLLDEPTNDLDIETLAVLEDVLDTWPGTLVVVSHDRYFVERVCDRVCALLGDDRIVELPGGVDEYLLRRSAAAAAPLPAPLRTTGAEAVPSRAAADRVAKKELMRLEREITRLDRREAGLHEDMAAHATDHERVLALDAELRGVRAEKAAVEDSWLALSLTL